MDIYISKDTPNISDENKNRRKNKMLKQKPPSKIEVTVSRLRDGGYTVRWTIISFTNLFRKSHRKAFTTQAEMLDFMALILAI
jgi:hypothetical protein